MRGLLVAVAILGAAGVASAATLKVPQQFGTIQAAVDAAADGDTIVVSRGTYEEDVVVATPNLHFVGRQARIDGNVGNAAGIGLLLNAPGATVQGFSFRNADIQIDIEADGCSVTKCTFVASDTYPIYGGSKGTGARIVGNRILSAGDDGVFLDGDGGFVQKNSFRNCEDAGIEAYGSGMTADRNTFVFVAYPVYIGGTGAVVTANRIQKFGDTGVYVDGNDFQVEGNSVKTGNDNGFEIYGTGGTVVRNLAVECAGSGFYFEVDGATIADATAISCGAYGDAAFDLDSGGNNTFTDCTATDCPEGFLVDGASNAFVRCAAAGYGDNGFRVFNHDGNSFTDCSAKGFSGQGFNNGGTNTVLTRGTFLGNRIDIADKAGVGATFAGGLGGVKFVTGGATTEPEL